MEGSEVLRGFTIERILSSDERTKYISVLGRYSGQDGRSVVILRRRHFEQSTLPRLLSPETHAELHFRNDIYAKYTGMIPQDLGEVSIDIINPATDKHISKYEDQTYHMVVETPEVYKLIVRPYIDSIPASRIQWVYNILEKKAEADRLIFEDADPETGFLMHPDLKWDERQIEALYCIAMVKRRDIKSLRDLRRHHLPLLHNILKNGCKALSMKYGISAEDLRVFCHYQPSYYHLHVHFVHIRCDIGMGMAIGKAHLLSDIIGNIELLKDYYARCTLEMSLGEKDPLAARIMTHLPWLRELGYQQEFYPE